MGLLAKLCVLLAATMFAIEGAIISIARLTSRDLFAPYLAIMPGQSIDALKDYPCQFRISTKMNTEWGVCEFSPELGPFGQIMLTAYGHIIEQTYMTVRQNQLHFGDLILCWGDFSLDNYDNSSAPPKWVARWGNAVYTDVRPEAVYGGVSHFMPIDHLVIEGEWRPCSA